jgi:hypothetical protein
MHRTYSTFQRVLGHEHHVTRRFQELSFSGPGSGGSRETSLGLLDAAIAELDLLATDMPAAEASGIDAELWEHVASEVQTEAWDKVAREAAVFTEDRIRKWAGRPVTEVGETLMTAVFGDQGDYRMGRTSGEKQGWHRFAMGISMALRNVDAHRIQNRSDDKRYALGVVGACSLLLTQMRYEHGNRFDDTSPASAEER